MAGLLQALIAASLVAEFWFVLTYLGWTPTVYVDGAAAWWGFSFNTANLSLLIWAARRVRAPRFSGERRQSVRFAVQSPGLLDGIKCLVRDLSATGALIEVDSAALASGVDRSHQLELELADGPARISCRVRRSGPSIRGRRLVGVEFAEHEVSTAARIARALMWNDASYGAVGERLAA